MLESFSIDTFTPHINEAFVLHADGVDLPLELVEATAVPPSAGPVPRGRQPFSIVFLGPRTPVLSQRIYVVEHSGLGAFELFLVPIGPDAKGMRYEAVFG